MPGLLAALLAACTPSLASGRTIDVQALHKALADDAVPVLVDVRSAGEYAGGHVPGAINIPLERVASAPELEAYREKEVFLICQSGGRSARAQSQLEANAFHTVNVSGGTGAWKAAGFPIE